jgi:hypothetical protein
MTTGEAAGVAAALAAKGNNCLPDLPVHELQLKLREAGVYLGEKQPQPKEIAA